MLRISRIVWLGWLVLGPCGAQEREEVYRLDTADYRIEMTVRFFPPYLGGRLAFHNSANPRKELCYSGNGDSSSCIERFVGALAAVTYRFQPRRKNLPAAATFREVVKVVSQPEGLDERPPYVREEPLLHGVGSDIQALATTKVRWRNRSGRRCGRRRAPGCGESTGRNCSSTETASRSELWSGNTRWTGSR